MKSIKEMKADHALRQVVTESDQRYYHEPAPLTEDQKEQVLIEAEEVKRRVSDKEVSERQWLERHYEDKTLTDH